MNTLTDRYVWAVLRATPEDQRAEIERELRALIADAIAGRGEAGASAAEAEREALVELGDPDVLAARYANRRLMLLGPTVYLPWLRLLRVVLPLATTIGVLAAVIGAGIDGREASGLIGVGIWAGISVAIQTVFWVTLVFALIDRFARTDLEHGRWSPEALPDVPAAGGRDATELVSTAATAAITLGFLAWQQAAAPVVIDGVGHPLIDPALWASWLPVLVGVLVADILLAVVSYVSGRWTWPFAVVNAAIALGFALPVVWLIQAGQLLEPALVRELAEAGQGEGLRIVLTILSIGIAAVTAYEIGDGFRRARRSGNRPAAGARRATSGSNG